MNYELRIMGNDKRKAFGFLHTSYFILHTSSAKQGGQAITLAALFFLIISLTIGLGVVSPVLNQVESVRSLERGAEGFYAAEGISQDITYRIIKGMTVDTVETLSFGGVATGTATTTAVLDGKEVLASGDRDRFVRKSKTMLSVGEGVTFNYGLQSGTGGIDLTNSALVVGNVYTNGPLTGSNSNLVRGTAVSAGPAGLIDGIHATSSAYAHTIRNSDIVGDAYYQTISNTSVAGTLYPGSTDLATTSLPISDSKIDEWKAEATAGGTHSSPCSYSITGAVTLGPRKINCDLNISGSAVVTLAGHVWVVGNITVSNSADIRVSASIGNKSVALIADNPSSPTSSGRITLSNTTEYFGSGQPGSYVLMVSQNKSAEQGGETSAITISNNNMAGDLLLYAGHGLITLSNSIRLKEVTAYRITAANTAQIMYETGLANLLFTGGPSGGYVFDSWREVE